MMMIPKLSTVNSSGVPCFQKIILLLLLFSFAFEAAYAASQVQTVFEKNGMDGRGNERALPAPSLSMVNGWLMLDYEVIPVPGIESIDLLGFHYLHQMNDWFSLGIGLHAPMLYGDYGGFMVVDATLHTQHKLYGNSFVDAGVSLGGGGGGSSIKQSKELSGSGGFIKGYLGLGYDFNDLSIGLNYAQVKFTDSLIDHSQFDLFIQKPFTFSVGPYASLGKMLESGFSFPESTEDMITLELNNMFQISPKGSNKKTINLFSLQFSHFLTKSYYLIFEGAVGYGGLPLYNQALAGLGYRYSMSPYVNVYGQMAVGSGGYAPTEIDTGSGFLVNPKLSLEYVLNNKLGLSLSSGYLFAPRGSSNNFTLGAAVNYHLSTDTGRGGRSSMGHDLVWRGFRFTLFPQTEFNVRAKDEKLANIKMISVQLDYVMKDHWFIPMQANVAYDEFLGYPGYGEILTGLGFQNRFSSTNHFQYFFEVLIGANVLGIAVKPAVGFNYTLSDTLALYGQLGETFSEKKFSAFSVGVGLTYRFSLADSVLE
jgi:hypothetical protein